MCCPLWDVCWCWRSGSDHRRPCSNRRHYYGACRVPVPVHRDQASPTVSVDTHTHNALCVIAVSKVLTCGCFSLVQLRNDLDDPHFRVYHHSPGHKYGAPCFVGEAKTLMCGICAQMFRSRRTAMRSCTTSSGFCTFSLGRCKSTTATQSAHLSSRLRTAVLSPLSRCSTTSSLPSRSCQS